MQILIARAEDTPTTMILPTLITIPLRPDLVILKQYHANGVTIPTNTQGCATGAMALIIAPYMS